MHKMHRNFEIFEHEKNLKEYKLLMACLKR